MLAKEFDALEWWKKLRAHIDAKSLAEVAGNLGVERVRVAGEARLIVCPLQECRSTSITSGGNSWQCIQCGAGGGPAALFAASVCGWTSADGDSDEQVRADFPKLAMESLFAGIGDIEGSEFFHAIPGSDKWDEPSRGTYQGPMRETSARKLARELSRAGIGGTPLARLLWAWSCAYCRPPLTRGELAKVFIDSAEARP